MLASILICIVAYLLGSIPTGYWLGKLLKGIDIRTVGSGSTGATNVLRSVGKGPAVFVLVFDMFKGAFPVLLGIAASEPPGHQSIPLPDFLTLQSDPSAAQMKFYIDHAILAGIAGILAMIGHSKSIFLGFQGGKSAATGLGTLAAMSPVAGACMFGVFVGTIAIGRFVSVGSMAAAFVGPFLMYYFTHGKMTFVIYNIIGSSYVIIRHQSNIKRLLAGTEPKIGQKADDKKVEDKKDEEKSEKKSDQSKIILLLALALSLGQTAGLAETSSKPHPQKSSTKGIIAAKSGTDPKKSKSDSASEFPEVFASAGPAPITPEEATNIKLYKNCSQAVVNVTSSKITPAEVIMYGISPDAGADTGSGSIISPDGYILTNYHVINGASMVRVTLHDGTQFMAKVVGTDPANDLAVLKIDAGARKLASIKLGDSSKLEVGRRIYTIGNPFGLDLTMTSGIISSVGRTLRTEAGHVIKGVLQTDAAINPGNSGGPLLDTQGNMIGVTTAILSKVQQSAGIGFAIPINIVKRIVPQLIAKGFVLRPDLGILRVRLSPTPSGTGLMVVATDPNGPSAQAGLKGPTVRRGQQGPFEVVQVDNSTADIIIGIDSQQVNSVDDLLSYVETKKPGQVVTLNVLRQGQATRIPVKLAETKAP